MLPWSKSKHVQFEDCPRRFFYSQIAAARNPRIRELAEESTPSLIRHEVVCETICAIAKETGWTSRSLARTLKSAQSALEKLIPDELQRNAEYSITETCVRTFVEEVLPDVRASKLVSIANKNPVEFIYDSLTMFVLPEMVLDRGTFVDILSWRTGSSGFRSERGHRLRAGGLTCWARSVLKEVRRPVHVTEVYLRESSPVPRYEVILTDEEVRLFVSEAKRVAASYSASARIADFPAKPSWASCRFCCFKSICNEYEAFAETDYELETLTESVREAGLSRGEELTATAGEVRSIYLSHVSEDKEEFVRPFARALEAQGISYWLDEAELHWGDSLTRGINRGLAISDFIVCFLSDRFIERGWPQAEIGAAIAAQMDDGRKRLLPIFLAGKESALNAFPLLRDLIYKEWAAGIDSLVQEVKQIVSGE
jgi:hypothetical protein